jgi:putative membrane protein
MTLADLFYGQMIVLGIEIGLVPCIIIGVLGILFGWFLIHYVLRGVMFLVAGKFLVREIRKLRSGNKEIAPESVRELMKTRKVLAHLWSLYEKTLHEHWETVNGERRRMRVRATVPASTYFTAPVLVDSRLAVRFFRHLPGIITGIGIAGTFYGFIIGLDRIDLQLDSQLLQVRLGYLDAVIEALIALGIAIVTAIVVAATEKLLLTNCYKTVEDLGQELDSLYELGAGAEYPSRPIHSSDQSAGQNRQMNNSLGDMRQLLTELNERQIEARRHHGELLARNVGDAIRSSLAEPMKVITDAVERTSSRQGEAVQGTPEDLRSAFAAELDGSIRDQITGLQEMVAGTVLTMERMRTDFTNMAEKIGEISSNASYMATDQIIGLTADAEERQRETGAALMEAVKEMRQQVAGGHAEMQEQTARTLDRLHLTLQTMLEETQAP